MKKLLAVAFISGLLMASCSKKETNSETNTMMNEPIVETPIVDSAAVIEPMAADSTLIKP